MAADDLTTPLGIGASKHRRFVLPIAVPRAVAGVLGLCLVVFALWALLVDDPFGGEPVAVVDLDLRPPAQPSRAGGPADPAAQTKPGATAPTPAGSGAEAPDKGASSGTRTVTIIDGISGKRHDLVIPDVPQSASRAIDQRLVEPTPHGAIPKIGADGARPAEIYARAVQGAADGPRVAIVVGGLGVSARATNEALAKLPAPVTLGFAPYGSDLERQVARARGEGREVLLQVPMEPFDYPDNDPGPRTLLTSLSPEQNVERLHWFMSRFQGYVGIANYMGARFTAAEPALSPVMRDAAKRGLIYFDDGTSARSLTGQIAGANNMAFARGSIVLDAAPTPAEIDNALARLEAIARERGVAIGVATATPASIDRITQWAKTAEGRGIVLVPISAVVSRPKSS